MDVELLCAHGACLGSGACVLVSLSTHPKKGTLQERHTHLMVGSGVLPCWQLKPSFAVGWSSWQTVRTCVWCFVVYLSQAQRSIQGFKSSTVHFKRGEAARPSIVALSIRGSASKAGRQHVDVRLWPIRTQTGHWKPGIKRAKEPQRCFAFTPMFY